MSQVPNKSSSLRYSPQRPWSKVQSSLHWHTKLNARTPCRNTRSVGSFHCRKQNAIEYRHRANLERAFLYVGTRNNDALGVPTRDVFLLQQRTLLVGPSRKANRDGGTSDTLTLEASFQENVLLAAADLLVSTSGEFVALRERRRRTGQLKLSAITHKKINKQKQSQTTT